MLNLLRSSRPSRTSFSTRCCMVWRQTPESAHIDSRESHPSGTGSHVAPVVSFIIAASQSLAVFAGVFFIFKIREGSKWGAATPCQFPLRGL
jgi:hypothetical protein